MLARLTILLNENEYVFFFAGSHDFPMIFQLHNGDKLPNLTIFLDVIK